jgi:endoglucanase
MLFTYKHSFRIYTNPAFRMVVAVLLLTMQAITAKSNPTTPSARLLAFKRARSLDNGVSVSWLEQTWNKSVLTQNGLKNTDLALLKKLGFKSIRLPVAFEHFDSEHIPVEQLFSHIDNIVKQCDLYGFKLIISYHYGNLNDTNYISETQRVINLWLKLTKKYKNTRYDNLFFELYNEPLHMNPQIWKDAAYNMVTALRKVDRQRTFIIGASNYNSIYELSRFVRLADENVIYTFHFYEPFLFTHQGATWIGDQEATVGVPFPYNAQTFPTLNEKAKNTAGEQNYNKYKLDGNEQSLRDKLQIVKDWGTKYDVPIICGEYGVYNKYADIDSRCRYIKAMRQTLKALNIPGIMWDYNSSFSIFSGEPSIENLPPCMRDAIGYSTQN